MKSIFKKISNVVRTVQVHRRMPLRLEFILSDYCNLNCKGCTHYSPLAVKEFEPIDTLLRDAEHLGRTVGNDIDAVYLIGGETLLYPWLPEAMDIMRRHFPTSKISLFTNGILLPKMDDAFWEAARRNNIVIAITIYPIPFDYDSAKAICDKQDTTYEIFDDRSVEGSFLRFSLDPAKRHNARLAHFKCFNRGCISVVNGKIYPCSISACVKHLNRACATDFKHLPGDMLNVADITDVKQIKTLRDRPVPFCGYCNPSPTVTPYGPSKHDKQEWVD